MDGPGVPRLPRAGLLSQEEQRLWVGEAPADVSRGVPEWSGALSSLVASPRAALTALGFLLPTSGAQSVAEGLCNGDDKELVLENMYCHLSHTATPELPPSTPFTVEGTKVP